MIAILTGAFIGWLAVTALGLPGLVVAFVVALIAGEVAS